MTQTIYSKEEFKNVLEYPRPRPTVDVILTKNTQILLIKRNQEPFKDCWVLPGGHIDKGEEAASAAARELKEETGVFILDCCFELLEVCSKTHNDEIEIDPRGWRITTVFHTDFYNKISYNDSIVDDEEVSDIRWFDITNLPKLGFGHEVFINNFLRRKINA